MKFKEIDTLVRKIERDEATLPLNHLIVKAMQVYLKHLYGEDYTLEVVQESIIVNCKQYSINYSITIQDALEHYEKER